MTNEQKFMDYGEAYRELAIEVAGSSFEDPLIPIEGRGGKQHMIPTSVAIDIAIDVTTSCFDLSEKETLPSVSVIDDPNTPSIRKVRNVLLSVMDEQNIPQPEIALALNYPYKTKNDRTRLEGAVAKARDIVTDDKPSNLLSTKFDVANGRYKREVEAWLYRQRLKTEIDLFARISEGDKDALEVVVKRNTDAILIEVARLFGSHVSDETLEEAIRFVREQAIGVIELKTPTEFDEKCIKGLEPRLTVFEEERARIAIEKHKEEVKPIEMDSIGTDTYRKHLKELLLSEEFKREEVEFDRILVKKVLVGAMTYINARIKGEIPPLIKNQPRHTTPRNTKTFEDTYRRRFKSVVKERVIASIALQQSNEISFDLIDLAQDRPDTYLRFLAGLADELSDTEFRQH